MHPAYFLVALLPMAHASHKSSTTLKTKTTKGVKTTTTAKGSSSTPPSSGGGGGGGGSASSGCTATSYSQIASVVASCTNIVLSNINAPANSPIDLTKLKSGSTVTFAGTTTFGTTKSNTFDPITISGNGITITGAPGHLINGNGPAYWDGLGSNGGSQKPDHFIVLKNIVNGVVSNLNIKNWPVHCFQVTSNQGLKISGIHLDNTDGNAANSASGGKPAAHNSDGFDISSSSDVTVSDCYVNNQDDCVAVTSGTNILVTKITCIGGHGLSIGSVGGKKNNVVDGVTFSDSTVTDSENGCRIKSNSGTTGSINKVTYSNIKLSGITKYGIDVQQDYLNGGPTGKATNGVKISNIVFDHVTGTVTSSAYNYYILCGSGSCSNFSFPGTSITGGKNSCNFPTSTCPA